MRPIIGGGMVSPIKPPARYEEKNQKRERLQLTSGRQPEQIFDSALKDGRVRL